jgi:SPP1 family predicted phage head-tail adaptor
MNIKIGDLRHRLNLERPARTSDNAGGFTKTWQHVVELWAQINPVSGRESLRKKRNTSRITHEIIIRYRKNILPTMRFTKGSRTFEILAILNEDEQNHWLKCHCEERDL